MEAPAHQFYEYKVAEFRETLVGDRIDGDSLQKLLNQHGREGWRVVDIAAAEVKGRLGPGAVPGLIVTFERPVA